MRYRSVLPLVAAFLLTLNVQSHTTAAVARAISGMPRVTVWAWQRREDLRSLDPLTTAVADLRRTIHLRGASLIVEPQRNTLILPNGVQRIAVVRLEATSVVLQDGTAEATAQAMVSALRPEDRALQIDFDAVKSQQAWYRSVLQRVRAAMPAGKKLSITALASWCSTDRWMANLPVEEAVPMLFRMEPGFRRGSQYRARLEDPLCRTSVGLSTREAWPREVAGRRIYLFPDAGWQVDNLSETLTKVQDKLR